MSKSIHITIYVEPHGKQRVRFSRRGGTFYTEEEIANVAAMKNALVPWLTGVSFKGPLSVAILAVRTPSISMEKKIKEDFAWCTQKPDIDNIEKMVFDCVTTLFKPLEKKKKRKKGQIQPKTKPPVYHKVWTDDAYIVHSQNLKVWATPSSPTRLEIIIKEIDYSPSIVWERCK